MTLLPRARLTPQIFLSGDPLASSPSPEWMAIAGQPFSIVGKWQMLFFWRPSDAAWTPQREPAIGQDGQRGVPRPLLLLHRQGMVTLRVRPPPPRRAMATGARPFHLHPLRHRPCLSKQDLCLRAAHMVANSGDLLLVVLYWECRRRSVHMVELEKKRRHWLELELTESKKEKIVKATKKGAAVLDQYIPDHIKTAYHVLQVGDEIYDATMNQTNVGENNNKFYIIQALESDAGGSFMVYSRWGRVGTRGKGKLQGPFSRGQAIDEFEGKFHDKTDIHWSYRKGSYSYANKYTWLEMDYGEADKETNKKTSSITNQLKETRLETRTASFISLICDISMMKQQMVEIGYNADKLPLGKLSKSIILKGYDVLKRISHVISRAEKGQLEQLTGEFYSVIPHDFGFKKMSEFIIDTPQKLKAKLEMVEALSEIEIAIKLLEDDSSDQDDPLYARYKQLCCDFTPLEVDSEEYSMVSRLGEMERFQKFASVGNRMLLWHGSRLTNWAGILSQGLRIAPPEAPITGFMFGKGVYFADMFSKSANYCYASEACKSGVLLLCEVALGEMNELLNGDYGANNLPNGKLSTKGVGQTAPNIAESKITDDGMVIPLGKPDKEPLRRGSLLYNEYIVYNVDQIRMRYILNVNFNFK
uniref:Poly [ADP-ribose] polymerase n=1 Tax=Oryza punctata TaxID=4537 RepID=A0A0E0JI87_ORYPU